MGEGLASFQRRMAAVPQAVRSAMAPALIKAAEQVAAMQRTFAETSRDTGALIDSITVTGPGQQTPPYSQPGGSIVVAENQAAVTVGNSDVRYPHLVEYGSVKSPAQPFFWPAYRLTKKRTGAAIKRAMSKAIRGVK